MSDQSRKKFVYAAQHDDPLACLALCILSKEGISTLRLTSNDAFGLNILPVFTFEGQFHNRTKFSRLVTTADVEERGFIIPSFAREATDKIALVSRSRAEIQGAMYERFRASLLHLHARLTTVHLLKQPRRVRIVRRLPRILRERAALQATL